MNRLLHIWTRLGDLAAFSGFYGAGCVLTVFVIAGVPVWWLGVLGAGLATWGVYLVDRIKLRDRDWDPADLAADERRHTWLRSHGVISRLQALLLIVAASALLASQLWWLGLLPLGGLGAVVLYTAGPEHGKRPKDVLLLKNAMTATGMSVLALGVVHAADVFAMHYWSGILWLWLVVMSDAAASDIDDRDTDTEFRTHTLATLGRSTQWMGIPSPLAFAFVLQMLAVGFLQPKSDSAFLLAVAVPLTTGGMLLLKPNRYREWIDLRLPLLAVLTWVYASL